MSEEPILAFMYTPAHFASDSDASARFLAEVVAGDLVTSTDGGLVATFLPVLLDAGPGAARGRRRVQTYFRRDRGRRVRIRVG
jgi:hypothetical protein